LLKGTLTRDVKPLVFSHKTTPPGSWYTGSLFEYGFEFAKKIDYEIADFGHSGVIYTAVTWPAVSLTLLRYQLCRISSRFRSYIRQGFNPCIMAPGKLIDVKKKPDITISCPGPCNGFESYCCHFSTITNRS
jgi:hypothetical protein